MSTALEVGTTLVALCREGKHVEAIETLYADNIVSVEAHAGTPEMPQTMEGKQTILGKNEWWMNNHEVHAFTCEGPYPHGDQFIVMFSIDVTAKAGPMADQRMQMTEAGLYTLEDGKIVKEQFFYAT